MSDKVGPLNFASGGQEVFLGRDFQSSEVYSQQTAQIIDGEIRRIVTEQHDRAKALLEGKRDGLENVAETLLEYETLGGDEIRVLMDGGEIERRPPTAQKPSDEDGEPAPKKRGIKLPDLKGVGDPEPDPA